MGAFRRPILSGVEFLEAVDVPFRAVGAVALAPPSFLKGMMQQRQAQSPLLPGTAHTQTVDTGFTISVLAEGDSGNFLAFKSDKPDRGIKPG